MYKDQLTISKDNIRKMKKNLPAGKTFCEALEENITVDAFPILDDKNVKTQEVTYYLFESSGTGVGYSDLTGQFPYCSSCSNK